MTQILCLKINLKAPRHLVQTNLITQPNLSLTKTVVNILSSSGPGPRQQDIVLIQNLKKGNYIRSKQELTSEVKSWWHMDVGFHSLPDQTLSPCDRISF